MALIIKILTAFFLHYRYCGRCGRSDEEQEGYVAWSDLEEGIADIEQQSAQQRKLQAEVGDIPGRLFHIYRKKWKEMI